MGSILQYVKWCKVLQKYFTYFGGKGLYFIHIQFFLFKPGITEPSSITDLLGELSRRASAAPMMWVGENSPNVVLLLVGQVHWGNSQVPSKWGVLSGLIAHIRNKNGMRLFIYTLMLFDNLGNIWGINQLLFLWRPVGGLQPRCSRWSHCKSNKTENKIWKKRKHIANTGFETIWKQVVRHSVCSSSLLVWKGLKMVSSSWEMPCRKLSYTWQQSVCSACIVLQLN